MAVHIPHRDWTACVQVDTHCFIVLFKLHRLDAFRISDVYSNG